MSAERCRCHAGCNGDGWDWSFRALPGSTPRDETTAYCVCPAGAELREREGRSPTWRDLVAQALPLLERAEALAEPLAQRVLGVALSTLRALLEADGPRPCAVRAEQDEPEAGLGVVRG